MGQATMKKDKYLLVLKSWSEFLYVIWELTEQLNKAKNEIRLEVDNFENLQKEFREIDIHSVKMSAERETLSAQILEYREKDNQNLEVINSLKKSLDQISRELSDCKKLKEIPEGEYERMYKANTRLQQELVEQSSGHLQSLQEKHASSEKVRPSIWDRTDVIETVSSLCPDMWSGEPAIVKRDIRENVSGVVSDYKSPLRGRGTYVH